MKNDSSDARRNERWLAPLMALARARGDVESVIHRAIELCCRLKISPWIALAVAERRISLADAAVLDRAARCKALQHAVLDRGMGLDALRHEWPYAPYLLAADLWEALGREPWRVEHLVEVARGLLEEEKGFLEDGRSRPVRVRDLSHYVEATRRVRVVKEKEHLDWTTAVAVVTGRMPLAVARRRAALERREIGRRQGATRPAQVSARGPAGSRRP